MTLRDACRTQTRFPAAVLSTAIFVSLVSPVRAAIETVETENFIVIHDSSNDRSWVEAQDYAQAVYGEHLASVHSSTELSEIADAVDTLPCFFDGAWLGGFDQLFFSWAWVDGTSWDFEDWAPLEPNDAGGCVWIDSMSSGMADSFCADTRSCFVVNRPDVTSVDNPDDSGDTRLALSPVRPNPFSDTMSLAVTLTRADAVKAIVFSVTGRRLRTLHSGEAPAGELRLEWDSHDMFGNPVPAGVYFLRVESGGVALNRRLVVLR